LGVNLKAQRRGVFTHESEAVRGVRALSVPSSRYDALQDDRQAGIVGRYARNWKPASHSHPDAFTVRKRAKGAPGREWSYCPDEQFVSRLPRRPRR